jgi:hypothetical protein
MFELRSQGYKEPVIEEGNFILHKTAIDQVRLVLGQEVDRGDALYEIRWADAHPESPKKVLLPRQHQVIEEVDVESVPSLTDSRLEMVRAVKVSLNLEVRSAVQNALPPAEEISSRQVRSAVGIDFRGR